MHVYLLDSYNRFCIDLMEWHRKFAIKISIWPCMCPANLKTKPTLGRISHSGCTTVNFMIKYRDALDLFITAVGGCWGTKTSSAGECSPVSC